MMKDSNTYQTSICDNQNTNPFQNKKELYNITIGDIKKVKNANNVMIVSLNILGICINLLSTFIIFSNLSIVEMHQEIVLMNAIVFIIGNLIMVSILFTMSKFNNILKSIIK